jgi:hypothetical protein
MKTSKRFLFLICLIAWGSTTCLHGEEKEKQASPIAASFVFMGCNRLGHGEYNPGDKSTANTAQLAQTIKDISSMSPTPEYFFSVGILSITKPTTKVRHCKLN